MQACDCELSKLCVFLCACVGECMCVSVQVWVLCVWCHLFTVVYMSVRVCALSQAQIYQGVCPKVFQASPTALHKTCLNCIWR